MRDLEDQVSSPGFWDQPSEAQQVLQALAATREGLERFRQLVRKYEDVRTLWELGVEEGDESMSAEVEEGFRELSRELEQARLEVLLSGRYDNHSAIVTLHAGAGGTEAMDWVEMLLRMYTRWGEDHGYQVQLLDTLPGDEAGLKSATILVKGVNAYGYLQAERGVHRLVRISPFDAASRRHTSFASVDVMPEVASDEEVDIDPEDLKIDTYRSGGAGGQHVNKTDSAVRITHLPSGIVVQCQNERSQHANRLTAMKILQAKLLELKQRKEEEEMSALRGVQQEIAWGSQIRSYVFHPYTLVKDHRTNTEVGNVQAVMDGHIDPFIGAYLQQQALKGAGQR
ncbi:peptide chain release factor 2 [Clostridiales bacterium PH28_bin88]|nr:peptide chain release factor 2 [Clostridiales bacterium PH28_bin88]